MAFYGLSKLPFASPQTLQNPPNTVPSRHPRAKATSRTGTPGPRPQQWLSMGFQSCRLPARKRSKPSKTFQTLQTPSRAGTPGPRPLPEQAPQGQGHSNGFLWAFKAAVCQPANSRHPRAKATSRTGTPQQWLSMGFQSCRLPARKPSKTLQNPPNPPNHPRAKATAMAFYGLSKLPFASPQTLQTPPKFQTPSLTGTPGPRPLPEQAPQGQGHSNGFL